MAGKLSRRLTAMVVWGAAVASLMGAVATPAGAIPQEPLDPCVRFPSRCAPVELEPQPTGNPVGSLERVAQWPVGGILVRGWASDPNTTASIDVQIAVDGAAVRTLTADLYRADQGGARGFEAVVNATAGSHNVCVTAINVGSGANTQIGCRVMDKIVNFEIDSIDYRLAQASIESRVVEGVYSTTVRNGTSVQQTSEISGTNSVSESAGWSDSLGFKVGVSAGVTVGVPVFVNNEIRVSAEATKSFTWNGSQSWAAGWSWKQPLVIPAYTEVRAVVTVAKSTITVPYTLTGRYVYESGSRFSGTLDGTYRGVNSHDLTVTLSGTNYAQASATITKTQFA